MEYINPRTTGAMYSLNNKIPRWRTNGGLNAERRMKKGGGFALSATDVRYIGRLNDTNI